MPKLERLILKYCFVEVHPTSFSLLANLNVKWRSIKYPNIKYAFGDPNWETEKIDQLVQRLQSLIDIHLDSRTGYLSLSIDEKEKED
jgi:hypothetical protein